MPSFLRSHSAKVLFAFLGGAILLGLILPRVLPAFPIVSDSLDYQNIAQGLVDQQTYLDISEEHLLYPPGYPVFLALIFAAQGHVGYTAVYFLQMLLVGVCAWLIYLSLKELEQTEKIALGGGLVTLGWPYLLLYAHLVASEIPYITLLIASATAFIHGMKRTGWTWPILTGVLFGLAILTRPVALLLPLAIGLFLGVLMLGRWLTVDKRVLRFCALVLGISWLAITPWVIAVSLHTGQFTPVASNLSFVFKKANTSLAYLPEHAGQEQHQATLSEVVQAKARNLVLFWNPGAGGDNMELLAQRHPIVLPFIWLYKIGYFVLLGLALFTLWRHRKNAKILVILAIILYFWAVHTILFPFPRYTLPLLPFVIALAACACGSLYDSSTPHLHSRKK